MNYLSSIKWSNILANGALSVLVGAFLIFYSYLLSKIIILILGGGMLITGLLFLINHYLGKSKKQFDHVYNLIQGIFYVAIGLGILIKPLLMTDIMLYIIGLWILATGISQLIYTFKLRKKIRFSYLLLAGGVLFILLGLFMVSFQYLVRTTNVVLGVLIGLQGFIMMYFSIPVYRLNQQQKSEKKPSVENK